VTGGAPRRLSALDRKALRDLKGLLGQGITIALVVGAGIAGFIALTTTFASLRSSQATYYERYRFGDAFAQLERAPESLLQRIEAIPGVAGAYSRIVAPVRIPLEDGEGQSAVGQVVSLPAEGLPPLNGIFLREGRLPTPGRSDEALLLDTFARRWGHAPGDTVRVVLNGALRPVRITGLATSPEFIYPVPAGGALIPDDERFAVFWMDRSGAAPLFQMEGAFNDLVLRFHRDASERQVLAQVDILLERYGGRGAVGRALQPSHFILEGELAQLRQFALVVPIIFLGVAAFLLNVVLSRLLHLQRTQIAALKALGYRRREIAGHFVKMMSGIVLAGSVLGCLLGAWLGGAMTRLYGSFFGFPVLAYELGWRAPLSGVCIALAAGALGIFGTLRSVLRLSPAEAMAPEPPARYRPTLIERLGAGRWIGPSGRMVLREVGRRPIRTLLSALGISLSLSILLVAQYSGDALEFLIETQFFRSWREDVTVTFNQPLPERAVRELLHLPGVQRAEGVRITAARVHVGHLWRDLPLQGYPSDSQLRQLVASDGSVHPLPNGGIVLTSKLGEVLGIRPGDTIRLTLREGRADTVQVAVTGFVDEMFGLQGHLRLEDLNALLREEPRVSQALLSVDSGRFEELERRLAESPRIADVARRDSLIRRFREQSGELLVVMELILTLFASVIAAGVVYNNARVAVSMRERDLASLRVIGFTRGEISTILLGELSVQVLLSIPLGLWIGVQLCEGLAATVDPERYRLPMVLTAGAYGYAVAVVLVASLTNALWVRRRLDHLDLIGVLKTRE
jgi:putative ABC transport system permease protein